MKPLNRFFVFIYYVVGFLAGILHPVSVEGMDRLPHGGALLCPNHSSDWDPVLVALKLPVNYRLHIMGAYLSKGGKSFICCSSSFKDKKTGELKTRIRPTLLEGSVVTATRANLHYLVTEYGKVNVKGLSTWQRAESIINIAHPQFREELIAEAEKMHIWRQSNKK